MKRISLRTPSSAALFLVGTVAAVSALAQPPQGAYGPGFGMDRGMTGGSSPGYDQGGGYRQGSGYNRMR